MGTAHSHLSLFSQLCLRLKRIRLAAKAWAKECRLPSIYLSNCRVVILLFDKLEETRLLSPLENRLRSLAKIALSKLNAASATYWRQRAKIRHCTLDDENSRYFHLYASGRLKKYQSKTLEAEDGDSVFSHPAKATILHGFFHALLGSPITTSDSFNLSDLVNLLRSIPPRRPPLSNPSP
jgi:hypothetical protein